VIRWVATLLILTLGFAMVWIRFSPNPAGEWAMNPMTHGQPGMENGWLIRPEGGDQAAPVYKMTPAELAAKINKVALARPRTRLLAGAPESGEMTYVTRSRFWGFPDFTSVRVLPSGSGASFAAFARARFGRSDLGVNRARLEAWLKALATP